MTQRRLLFLFQEQKKKEGEKDKDSDKEEDAGTVCCTCHGADPGHTRVLIVRAGAQSQSRLKRKRRKEICRNIQNTDGCHRRAGYIKCKNNGAANWPYFNDKSFFMKYSCLAIILKSVLFHSEVLESSFPCTKTRQRLD